MALSKPKNFLFHLSAAYLQRLYTNPLKTKAITSCILAALGNLVSQKISGAKRINEDALLAFALFGLIFGGPVPHYFYTYLQDVIRNPLTFLLIHRLVFTPCFQAFTLYMLPLFEGRTHEEACAHLKQTYWPVLTANLKYLTLIQYLNFRYVPPLLQVPATNLIAFIWTIYIAQQWKKTTNKTGKK